jgi:hypothetical protein
MENVAVPHVRVGDQTYATDFADQDNIGPAAAVSSSASDLSQWLMMMVRGGRHGAQQFLEPQTVNEMLRPQILMAGDPVHGKHAFDACGLGLMLWDYQGGRIAAHSGMAGHSWAMIGFAPERRVGVAVLTNHRRCLFHYAAFRRALDLYCGQELVDLDPKNKQLVAELVERQDASLKRREAARDPAKRAALPLESYAGRYQGQYKTIAVLGTDAGQLVLRYGNQVADVSHWHDETFRARLREQRLADEQDWWLTFTVANGAVSRLHIHSEHDVHDDFKPVAKELE